MLLKRRKEPSESELSNDSPERSVAEYYDQTQNHFETWWNLAHTRSLHYGIWTDGVKSFADSLHNTNQIMAEKAGITTNQHILDAGCGVGGAAIYLAQSFHATVEAITLSDKQIQTARKNIRAEQLESRINVSKQDYTATTFPDQTFDTIWMCESISSCADKALLFNEANRILKPHGKIVIADIFSSNPHPDLQLQRWSDLWAMATLETVKQVVGYATPWFEVTTFDYTSAIRQSARRMYVSSILGFVPSRLYNLFNRVSRYGRDHVLSGFVQYKTLKQGLWKYPVLVCTKK